MINFDGLIPDEEKFTLNKNELAYIRKYEPIEDDELMDEGIEIIAMTRLQDNKVISNEIIFTNGKDEVSIECTETIVDLYLFMEKHEQGKELEDRLPVTKKDAILLTPDENFFTLTLYIETMIKSGILHSAFSAFNDRYFQDTHVLMVKDALIHVIIALIPKLAMIFIKFLIIEVYMTQPEIFMGIMQQNKENDLWRMAALLLREMDFEEEVISRLANEVDPDVRAEIAQRNDLSRGLIYKLASDRDPKVRLEIAKRKNLSQKLITRFKKDYSRQVRNLIYQKYKNRQKYRGKRTHARNKTKNKN